MARDWLNAEIARQRQSELRRNAERNARSVVSMSLHPQRATIDDFVAIVDERREFWGDRDLTALHHPLLVHEFGETALVIRDVGAERGDGQVIAYLFGLLSPSGVGYIHVAAVRDGHRREGLARRLYEHFEELARVHGAHALKAITKPVNARSIAFHRALGFSANESVDHGGPGQTRTVLWKEISPAGGHAPADITAGLSN
jgi:ribosomal protein S18 acetylase RimI-like enzyme